MKFLAGLATAAIACCFGALPASGAEEATGPPQISDLHAEAPSRGHRVHLTATIAPGNLTTTWRVEISHFRPCGPIRVPPKRQREPRKIAEGTIAAGATEIRASTGYKENGAGVFYVHAVNADGESSDSHHIPQPECVRE